MKSYRPCESPEEFQEDLICPVCGGQAELYGR